MEPFEHPHYDDAELGIIRHPRFGYDPDFRQVRLSFSVNFKRGGTGLSFGGDEAEQILKDARAQDVQQLEGLPCWVWVEGTGMAKVHFLGIAKEI